jgi:serine/threonine protein kinase
MGDVSRARDSRLNRDVAIKVLPDEFARDAARIARFEFEAQALAALNHPNILRLHDFGFTKLRLKPTWRTGLIVASGVIRAYSSV